MRTTDSATDNELPKLPFVTTSDVLNQLNHHLQQLSTKDDNVDDDDRNTNGGGSLQARFELQKRLPDGSAIPATPADIAYSDLQTKLDQSAKFVASLESREDRAWWAEEQRKMGNAYFYRANYQAAMDIYLTCLVVKDDTLNFVQQTFLPVLNNLAQCTLQLGMHKKTIEFCNIALEEIFKYHQQGDSKKKKEEDVKAEENVHHDQDVCMDALSICKIYYKRAKARRLTGWYKEARQDLHQASRWLDRHVQTPSTSTTSTTTTAAATTAAATTAAANGEDGYDSHHKAIQKEFRNLESAESEARKNRQKQKQSLQKALSFSTTNTTNNNNNHPTTATCTTTTKAKTSTSGLVEPNVPQPPRPYSTLRKRTPMVESSMTIVQQDQEKESKQPSLSYFQYYCLVVTRVIELLLVWLGDEETKEEIQRRLETAGPH